MYLPFTQDEKKKEKIQKNLINISSLIFDKQKNLWPTFSTCLTLEVFKLTHLFYSIQITWLIGGKISRNIIIILFVIIIQNVQNP